MNHTEEDAEIFDSFILIPYVIKNFERDMKIIEKSPFKLKHPYTYLIDEAILLARADLREVKKEMHLKGLKMWHEPTASDDMFTEFVYKCRGYEGSMRYMNANIKKRVGEIMLSYLSQAQSTKQYDGKLRV
ncbi:hypothetical protein ACFPU1_16810 [Thalassorhabdus alkalitolerans]|uniref:Uncharacterized protein n=1 Tax=Thalassorhabdus alkalitolerans TaxID=2282697 RepID=A0ABW0YWJ5_9BACI